MPSHNISRKRPDLLIVRDAGRVWQRQRRKGAERLNIIRSRVRRSLDDSRPDLTGDEVQAKLDAMFAEAENDDRRA